MPIEVAKGDIMLGLSCPIQRLGFAVVSFKGLNFEVTMLLSLYSFPPLDIVLQVILSDDCFNQWAGKSMHKCAHVRGIVRINPSSVGQAFKCHNIFIDLSFFHFEVFHHILGFLTFGEVGEGVKEILHHYFPWCLAHDQSWISFYSVEPIILHFGPSFDHWSFQKGEEVGVLFDIVLCDGGSIIHKHELTELSKEVPCV